MYLETEISPDVANPSFTKKTFAAATLKDIKDYVGKSLSSIKGGPIEFRKNVLPKGDKKGRKIAKWVFWKNRMGNKYSISL